MNAPLLVLTVILAAVASASFRPAVRAYLERRCVRRRLQAIARQRYIDAYRATDMDCEQDLPINERELARRAELRTHR
jgi:hypothetical protein